MVTDGLIGITKTVAVAGCIHVKDTSAWFVVIAVIGTCTAASAALD